MRLSTITFIIFYVGIVVSPLQAHGGQDSLSTGEAVSQTLALLGLSLLCGELIFKAFVDCSGLQERRSLWMGWVVIGLAGVLILTTQAQNNGQSPTQFLLDSEHQVVGGLAFGVIWSVWLAVWFLLGALLLQRPHQRMMALGVAVFVTLLSEFSRHPLSLEDTPLLLVSDAALQLACAVFLGLLLYGINAMRQQHSLHVRPLAYWLSGAALLVLVALLIQQGFPQTRLLQMSVMLLLSGLILVQRLWIRSSRLVLMQIGLASAVLVLINPFTYSRLLPQTTQLDYQVQINAQVSASLEVYPALPGLNTFYLTLIDSQTGLRLDDVSRTDITLSDQESISLVSIGDGVYSAEATLSVSGSREAMVFIQRPNQPDLTLHFVYEVSAESR